jgi:hypothetical protein
VEEAAMAVGPVHHGGDGEAPGGGGWRGINHPLILVARQEVIHRFISPR